MSFLYNPDAFAKLYDTEIANVSGAATSRYAKSITREGLNTRLSVMYHTGADQRLQQFTVGPSVVWRLHTRLISDDGTVLSTEDIDFPRWGTGSTTVYNGTVVRGSRSILGVVWNDGGVRPGRWGANGVMGTDDITFPHGVTNAVAHTRLGSHEGKYYSDGAVFILSSGSVGTGAGDPPCVVKYATAGIDALPTNAPTGYSVDLPAGLPTAATPPSLEQMARAVCLLGSSPPRTLSLLIFHRPWRLSRRGRGLRRAA